MPIYRWWKITLLQTALGRVFSTIYNYRATLTDPPDANVFIAQAFEDDILPAINGVQHTGCDNTYIITDNRTDGYGPVQSSVGGAGLEPAADNERANGQLAMYLKLIAPITKQFSDGQNVTSRYIRFGKKYIGGLSVNWNDEGVVNTAFRVADMNALIAVFDDELVVAGSDNLIPIVHGYALPATGEKPAREEVFADIIGSNLVKLAWLDSRETT